ncbi:TPA: flagellar hook-associated protein FlgK [Pseudomonas aeruginosa]|uniref:flagellar hook-associated protein FlgK n=1 Tax=Pseudomonas aeruginosa TaxID=287 RepID=UPI00053F253D|nr:flagellar hook-associated protein FlgK [Pseudomonas aeruginosa]EJB8399409.1 flagellar hook-associated protein FlgK [Pseudomonas aeruginosa]EKJ6825021.1 flagellar hook-associated protein FlgK [Pseudomonas aeruginosa]ELG7842665.1 flagellar hook-associated protein FlgK [Pseudomonas aeruginosa]KAA5675874.1 flagellar hook-associated protein FlgK [Pseudomonas aeruginosa]MBG4919307.1 flagellar hook-associated protein FlgK [Pseudomonas aeruginosa]
MSDLLSIGLSGLGTSQTWLTITGHNITNVKTPGYSRQDAIQQTQVPQFSGAGYMGSGSQIVDVRRLASDFLTGQLRNATSQNSELSAFRSQIEQLDGLLSNTTTGVSPAMQRFFAALQAAANNPSSTEAREAVLAQAEGLGKTFNTLYDQLDKQNSLINQQLGALASQVNHLSQSVASYNDAIAKAKSAGAVPNDLMDARDEAVRKLSEMIGVTAVTQDDNSVSLFIGSGQPLVVGNTVSTLSVVPGLDDPTRYQVQLSNGNSIQNVTGLVSGGEMGGLLAYRNSALDSSYNKLGQLAITLADTINKQLGQGLDLAGKAGANLFGDINDPDITALRVLAKNGNTGNVHANLNITDTSKLNSSDFRLDFDGTSFTARRLGDDASMQVTVSGTGPYTLSFKDANGVDQGFNLTLDQLPAAGDRFTLQPTRRGAADIETTLKNASQLAFAGTARTESTTENRGTGKIGAPTLTSGPSPVDPTVLQGAFGPNGISLGATLSADGKTYTLSSPLPAGWSYVDKDGNALTGSPTLTSGNTNTVRMAFTDPSGQKYSYEFELSGVPQNSDSFKLGFNDKGISDNRNALNLLALQTKPTVGGTDNTGSTYNEAYGGLVERVGTLTAQVRASSEASATVLKQAQDSRDSLSGVSLDEEAANLIQFQQYYGASAQVIQVARTLFDTLIGAFR